MLHEKLAFLNGKLFIIYISKITYVLYQESILCQNNHILKCSVFLFIFAELVTVLEDLQDDIQAIIDYLKSGGSNNSLQNAIEKFLNDLQPLLSPNGIVYQLQGIIIIFADPIMKWCYSFADNNPLVLYVLDLLFGPTGEHDFITS